jgi:hypothetical protein
MSEVIGNYGSEVGYQHQDLVQQAEEGLIKPSHAYVQLRALKSEIDEGLKAVESLVVDELTKLNDKEELVALGHKISHMKGRTSFAYKECDKWEEVNSERKRIEGLIKVATQQNAEIVDKETGEIIEPVTIKNGKGYLKMERA